MSPASGDEGKILPIFLIARCLQVSIQLMSPASGDLNTLLMSMRLLSFHSINVPSEWGRPETETEDEEDTETEVSIQLMSPASGDGWKLTTHVTLMKKFPFN